MKSRSVKFHLLLWFMIILFGGYLGLSIYLAPSISSGSISQTPDTNAPDIDIDAQPSVSDSSQPQTEQEKTKVPTNAMQLVNYALNLYNEGKGSLSYGTYEISNSGKFLGIDAKGTQYAIFKTVKSGTQNLEESYFYYFVDKDYSAVEKILVDNHLLRTGYRAINVDEEADSAIVVETNKTTINKGDVNCANWKHDLTDSSAQKRTFNTIESALNTYKIIYSRDFPLEINDNNCKLNSYNSKSDPQYSYITYSYDVNKLPDSFRYYYKANGGLQEVTYSSYIYTFKISKKTGRLAQIVREEKFTSYALNGMIKIDSSAKFTQTFYSMDKAQQVPQIYTEWPEKK